MLIIDSPERICTERYDPYRSNILEAIELEEGVLELITVKKYEIEEQNGIKIKKCVLTHGFDNGTFFGIDFSKVNIVCGDTYPARKILKKNFAWWEPQWINRNYISKYIHGIDE